MEVEKGKKKRTTHGLSSNRFYICWRHMMLRCTDIKDKEYKNYGGRGISVCEEWKDIKNFVEWAESTHPNIEGYTLDRIDVNGNYGPSNCRWADASLQAINKRKQVNNTSGFVGIDYRPNKNKYVARVRMNNKRIYLGYFNTIEEAVQARDNYIIQNNLPHKLSTEYKKE